MGKLSSHFRLYLFFQSRDFPETPYLALRYHSLQHLEGWLWPSYNEGHFTWRTKHLLGCIFSSVLQGIFLKFHIWHSFTMAYDTNFGHNWSLMKDTLLEEQSTLSVISFLPFKGFSRNSTSCTCHHGQHHLFVLDWSIYNERHFAWRTKYFGCISSSVRAIFPELRVLHSATMTYNTRTFTIGLEWRANYVKNKVPCQLVSSFFHSTTCTFRTYMMPLGITGLERPSTT